jgi:hypothetical protein
MFQIHLKINYSFSLVVLKAWNENTLKPEILWYQNITKAPLIKALWIKGSVYQTSANQDQPSVLVGFT